MKRSLAKQLEKRLDLDIDRILESPKLRLQLSPAELDRQLLDFYNKITEGPSGDILRIIGGGQEVALQSLYIKRKASQTRANSVKFGPFEALGDDSEEDKRTASQRINLALRRNIPKNEVPISRNSEEPGTKSSDKSKMSMSLSLGANSGRSPFWSGNQKSFTKPACLGRTRTSSFSLLI